MPGCYPTSVNLGLYPLAKAGWLGDRVIVDSKSGVSGAGRKPELNYRFVEANENITPYNVGYRHRHVAEMEQVLNSANGKQHDTRFLSPPSAAGESGHSQHNLCGCARGITESQIRELYAESYDGEPFIHLIKPGRQASLNHTVNADRCAIAITPADPSRPDGTEYIVTASLDNLIKGQAAGVAVFQYH